MYHRNCVMGMKLFVFLILVLIIISGIPQNTFSEQEPQTTIRTEVALVNLFFTAKDKKGRPVQNLKADDFQVTENRRPQEIEYFSELGERNDVPLTIALLIDTSGSVKKKLEYEKETAAEFFREILRPNQDLALIMQFDSEVFLVQDFTQSTEALINALDTLRAGNSTSLYDAVYLAAEEKLKHEIGRKVMVVITDGEDTVSKVTKEEAIEAAQRSDSLIYGIGVRNPEFRHNFGVLEKFAEETGGDFFSPRARVDEIREAFRSIGEDLKGQYSLAYRSTDRRKDGKFRSISIRCKVKDVRIRARGGYYAPKADPILR